MKIESTDGRFIALCHKLDEFLNDAVGGEKQRTQYIQYNTLENIHDVVLVVEGGEAVGCGSFKQYSDHAAEVKRVFVDERYRGRGVGKTIMEQLEVMAKEKGYDALRLETGKILKGAMHLYSSLGYQVIPNYGPYESMEESVCMEKSIAAL